MSKNNHYTTLINGKKMSADWVYDRGLAYGDGVFETITLRRGRPEFLEAHLTRLASSCCRLGFIMPPQLHCDIQTMCAPLQTPSNRPPLAVLKILISRGIGGRGYRPPENPKPTCILTVHPWPDAIDVKALHGVRMRLCHLQLSHQPALAGVKHCNRIEQVLARQEWSDPDIDEGVLCDNQGRLVEAVAANLFLVEGKRIATPAINNCGIAGIMRSVVLEIAQLDGLEASCQDLSVEHLMTADEIFLTNAVIGIWPVRRYQDRILTPGLVTRHLQQLVEDKRQASAEGQHEAQ